MEKINQWWIVVILIITAVLYIPSFDNEFTNWDDNFTIVQNADIKKIDAPAVKKIFTSTYVGMYMPVTMLTYAIDFYFSTNSNLSFHITNLLLHLFTVFLLWRLFNNLKIPFIYGFLGCLIFAVHPLNSEAVYWISSRGQLLFALFAFLSINWFIKFKTTENNIWYALSLAAFVFGLLSKSIIVVLPLILLVLEHFVRKQKLKNYIFALIPFFVLSVLFSVVTYYVRTGMQEEDAIVTLTQWYHRPFLVLYSWVFYIIKFFVPLDLSAYHPYVPSINNGLATRYYFFSFIGILIIFLLFVFRKRLNTWPLLLFVIFLLPVCNLIPFGRSIVAERYAYPSIIGLELFLIFLISKIQQQIFKKIILFLSVIWVLFLGYQTYKQDKYWQNSVMLWQNVTRVYPDDYFSFYMYGNALTEINDFYKAILQYNKALELKPADYKVLNNRGNVYALVENYDAALQDYSEVLKIHPNDLTFFNRAKVYLSIHKIDKACEDFRNANNYGHPDALHYFDKLCKK